MEFIPNTIFRVCKGIPLDKKYTDTLNFGDIYAQTTYFYSKVKREFSDFTYQRQTNSVRIPVEADAVYDCNYIMFANNNYGQKWFYGFIETITYISPKATEITYTIDVMQTWMFEYQVMPSFVEREHVSDDTLFANLVPENLEYGDNIIVTEAFNNWGNLGIVVAYNPMSTTESGGELRDGVFTGVKYLVFTLDKITTPDGINKFIQAFAEAGQLSAIVAIFMVPLQFLATDPPVMHLNLYQEFHTMDGYTPKNNKLFNFPYHFLALNNCEGAEQQYPFEYFADPGHIVFTQEWSLNLAASAITYPMDYKNWDKNYDEGLVQTNFPVCSWDGNVYANWYALNRMGITQGAINSIVPNLAMGYGGAVEGASALAGVGGLAGGVGIISSITNAMTQVFQKSIAPTQLMGQAKCSVGNVKWRGLGCQFKYYGIKAQFAKRIDDYFTMFGYRVNSVKVPNITGRKAWNYVKTADVKIIGSIPVQHMVQIKSAFDRGITFWHGDWVGDYSKDNSLGIVNPFAPAVFVSATTSTNGWVVSFKCSKAMQTISSGNYNFTVKINGTSVPVESIALNEADNTQYDLGLIGKPINTGDTVTLSYIGSEILAQDASILGIFNNENVTNNSTVGPVTFVSAEVSKNGWIVLFTCSEEMQAITEGNYNFTVKVNDTIVPIASITLNATDNTKYELGVMTKPILSSDKVTVSYSGVNILAADGGILTAFTDKPVTNNSTVGPAKALSAAVSTNGWVISVACSKIMKVAGLTGFSATINGAKIPLSYITLNSSDNTKYDIGLQAKAVNTGDIVTVSYNGTSVMAADESVLANFNLTASNSSVVSPVDAISAFTSANGWVITFQCTKTMKPISGGNYDFTVTINGVSVGSSAIAINPLDSTKYDLSLLGKNVLQGDTVTLSYRGTNITAADNSILNPFTLPVTNNSSVVPTTLIAACTSTNGWVITLICNKPMKPITESNYNFTVLVNGESVGASWIQPTPGNPNAYDLGLMAKAAKQGDTVQLSYNGSNLYATDNSMLAPFNNAGVANLVS